MVIKEKNGNHNISQLPTGLRKVIHSLKYRKMVNYKYFELQWVMKVQKVNKLILFQEISLEKVIRITLNPNLTRSISERT